MNKGLDNLNIYKLACNLEKEVYQAIKNFPPDEKYRKSDQILRSTSSICDNIAEGYGKFSYQSKIQSFYTARGEAEEARSQIVRAINLEILKIDKDLEGGYTELIKGINGYIRFLRNEKGKKEHLS